MGDEVQELLQFGLEFQFLAREGGVGHRGLLRRENSVSSLIIRRRLLWPEGRFDGLVRQRYDEEPFSRRLLHMTGSNASPGLWIPFVNPVEIFPVTGVGVIEYSASYNAVCHQLTADGMMLLQPQPAAPQRVVVGVHCEGRIFFLPGNRADFGPLGGDVFELQTRFTKRFDPKEPPPKIEFIDDDEVGSWVREIHGRRTPPVEKRKHERTVYNEEVAMDGPGRNRPAFALNISEGGLALITTFLLAVGEVRVLQLPQPDGTTIQKKLRIVRCKEIIPRFYDVGGQFVTD